MQEQPKIAVIGGGIAGITAARNLADRGLDVALIERAPALGGNATTVCCKAIDGQCQLCGACLLADALDDLSVRKDIAISLDTTVTRVHRADGGFSLSLSSAEGDRALTADAIILATGFDHVDAHTKGPYGYGVLPAVITGEEMERRIVEAGRDAYQGMGLKDVAFVQCVGSRDEHVGRGYCSQVCCRYAVRLARLLKSQDPELDVTVYKMDIQTSGRDFCSFWQASRDEGIGYVAGLPAVIRRSQEDAARATFVYDDVLAGNVESHDHDLIVLSTGIQPRCDAPQVADQFQINLNRFGFYETASDSTSTIVPGVFVAGCCQAPRSIAESVAHARQATQACYSFLVREGA